MNRVARVTAWLRCLIATILLLSGAVALAKAPAGRYKIDYAGTGTVFDTKTNRTWQRAAPTTGGVNANGTYNWADAKTYCANLSLGTPASGWRLPDVRELLSIVDLSEKSPAIDTTAFPATQTDTYFWSASPLQCSSSYAWLVYFYNGYSYNLGVADTNRVRCVR